MSNQIGNVPPSSPQGGSQADNFIQSGQEEDIDLNYLFKSTIGQVTSNNPATLDALIASSDRPDLSIMDYQRVIQDATAKWKNQLIDNIIGYITELLRLKAAALIALQQDSATSYKALSLGDTIDTTATDANNDVNAQNSYASIYNSGGIVSITNDKSVTDDLNSAATNLNTATATLQAAYAANNGTGTPSQAQLGAYYNAQVAYQTALTNYNSYIDYRNITTQTYNDAATAYNGKVSSTNTTIASINADIENYSSSLPQLTPLQTASLANMMPAANAAPAYVVTRNFLGVYSTTSTRSQLQNVGSLTSPPTTGISPVPTVLSANNLTILKNYLKDIASSIAQIIGTIIQSLKIKGIDLNANIESLISTQLSKLLIPDAIIQSIEMIATTPQGGDPRGIATQTLLTSQNSGVEHIQLITADLLQTISINISGTQLTTDAMKSISMLAASSLQDTVIAALQLAFGQLSDQLQRLGPSHPALQIAFAINFLNLVSSKIDSGSLVSAYSALINQSPEFANLTDDQKSDLAKQIGNTVGSAELLTASNYTGQTVGVPTLTSQTVSQLPEGTLGNTSGSTTTPATNSSSTPSTSDVNNTVDALTGQYTAQGFGPFESQTLAQNVAAALQSGPIAATATSISSNGVDKDRLNRSTVSALLLQRHNLDSANNIANQVQSLLQTGGPFTNKEAFQDQAEQVFQANGLTRNAAAAAAAQLVLAPSNANTPLPSENQAQALADRVSPLLSSVAYGNTASQLVSSLVTAVYGAPSTDGSPPIGLASRLHDTLVAARKKDDEVVAEKQANFVEDFKPLKLATSPAYLLTEVRNLANLFTHSIYQGIMYEGAIKVSANDEAQRSGRV